MKRISLLIIALFTMTIIHGQTQTVKGLVIDKQSEYPLPQAEVVVTSAGEDYWATTNFDGEYVIDDVPVGKISIKAMYNGFSTSYKSNLDLQPGKELVVNFSLLEKLEQLDEVVVQTARKRESTAFVSTSAAKFDVAQVGQYAGSLNDVSRMAMNYAGVSSNDDSRNDIIVRGNNPASLLWVIEGTSVPSPNHYSTSGSSGGPVSMLNINTLSKSDFLSGAFPANYGNTTAAAFDLQFRKPNNSKTEFVGQIGFGGLEFGVEGPFSKAHKASYLVNYRYSTLAVFDKIGFDIGVGAAVPKYQDINTVFNIPTKNAGKFKIWAIGGISSITFENTDDSTNSYFNQDNSILSQDNKNLISGISHTYFFNKKTSSKVSLSYSTINQLVNLDELDTATNTYQQTFNENLGTNQLTIAAKVNSKVNAKNKLSAGVDFTQYNLDFDMLIDTRHNITNGDAGLLGVYSSWQHRFTENLVMNTGLRYQYFSLNKQGAVEPRLGLKYQAGKTNFSIAYGLHSNINSMMSYFTQQEITANQYEYRNRDLGFVQSHHVVLGVGTYLASKVKLKTEFYYQSLFNVPISHDDATYSIINSGYNDAGGAQIVFDELYNEGKGKNYGMDVTLEYPLKNGFYALLTGSVYDSKYTGYDGIERNTAWNGNFMTSFLTGKSFKINEKSEVGFDLNINYAGGRRYTPIDLVASGAQGEAVYKTDENFDYKLPKYKRVDLKLSYKRNGKHLNQEWNVDLRNLFNQKNILSQNYNVNTNSISTSYQTGFLPVVQYRILF